MIDHNRQLNLSFIEGAGNVDGRFVNVVRLDPDGGSGYFSLVFTAIDDITGKSVVLKVFNPAFTADDYRRKSFEREGDILGELLGQRDIIQLAGGRSTFSVSVPMVGGRSYLLPFSYYAVERAKSSVAAKIAENGWDTEQILIGFRQMCRAVQRLHHRRIVHRDLKPGNFLIMDDGSVKLSDFGTARRLDGRSDSISDVYSGPPGDLRYCAPEMTAGLHDEFAAIAYWADVYALGAILFELLTGTQLGLQILDESYQILLIQAMSKVPRGKRRDIYDQFVRSIVARYPLPSIAAFGTPVAPCIRGMVDNLYKSLAALDYRDRLLRFGAGVDRHLPLSKQMAQLPMPSFEWVFLRIDRCVATLRHEERTRRRRIQRQTRRHGNGSMVATDHTGVRT